MRPDEGKIEILMGLKLHKGKRELQRLLRLIRVFDYLSETIHTKYFYNYSCIKTIVKTKFVLYTE